MTDAREFDIVLFGATGYTGRLVAEELLARSNGFRWALAGRDVRKLEAVKTHLVERDPAAAALPLLIADSHDRASLDAIARRTRVVCTTVGPYALHGAELVAACATSGTHYCDLTGEAPFMRQMIDRHHDTARRTGARIVHACGFDSIPSDLGVLLADEAMRQRSGGLPCESATLHVVKLRGGASGGTLASMLNLVDAARRDPEVRAILLDPYSLNPEGERHGPDGRDRFGMESGPDGYLAPFVMGAVNTRVVRRTNALMGFRYGRGFRYREVSRFPRSPKGFFAAAGMSAGLAVFMAAVATPGLRTLVASALPKPGEGPTAEQRDKGLFRILVEGERRDGEVIRKVTVRVEGDRDPGYGFTAVMLAESALCLALDPLTTEGGVLTPASAMGLTLVKRLRGAGMVLSVE
jgi:short subunit dehydrogenase-like uncharacterized protein